MPPLEGTLAGLPAGELRERRLREAAAIVERPEPLSQAHADALLPPEELEQLLAAAGPGGWKRLLHDWQYTARPTQLAPSSSDWLIWMILAGRGWGKTRTGVEWMRGDIDAGEANPFGLIGPTRRDVLDRLVYGDAGAPGLVRLYDHFPAELRPVVNKNDNKIFFPHNGTEGYFFTAEKPEVRGPNMRRWLCDEFAQWRYLRECWDNIEMTTRARGRRPPRICITTTPRPLSVIKDLLDDPSVAVTFGSTFANASNLASTWVRRMARKYKGSRLGLQELLGLVLGDNPDALFRQSSIDDARVTRPPCKIIRIAIGVDPAISANRRSDLTGIVVVGLGEDGELYVLADLTGIELDRKALPMPKSSPGRLVYFHPDEAAKHAPEVWGEIVCRAYRHFGREYECPVVVVGERNRGGDLVKSNVLQVDQLTGGAGAIPFEEVRATRGKTARAEEVSTLSQQGRVHHVGQLPALEQEVTEWNPRLQPLSPNRLDGLVWAAFLLIPELATGERVKDPKAAWKGFGRPDEDATKSTSSGMSYGGFGGLTPPGDRGMM